MLPETYESAFMECDVCKCLSTDSPWLSKTELWTPAQDDQRVLVLVDDSSYINDVQGFLEDSGVHPYAAYTRAIKCNLNLMPQDVSTAATICSVWTRQIAAMAKKAGLITLIIGELGRAQLNALNIPPFATRSHTIFGRVGYIPFDSLGTPEANTFLASIKGLVK